MKIFLSKIIPSDLLNINDLSGELTVRTSWNFSILCVLLSTHKPVIHYIWNSEIESRQASKVAGQYYLRLQEFVYISLAYCIYQNIVWYPILANSYFTGEQYIPVTRPGHISLPSVWSPRGPAEVLAPGGGPGSRGDVSSIYTGTTDHTPGQTFRAFISSHFVPKVQFWYYS